MKLIPSTLFTLLTLFVANAKGDILLGEKRDLEHTSSKLIQKTNPDKFKPNNGQIFEFEPAEYLSRLLKKELDFPKMNGELGHRDLQVGLFWIFLLFFWSTYLSVFSLTLTPPPTKSPTVKPSISMKPSNKPSAKPSSRPSVKPSAKPQ